MLLRYGGMNFSRAEAICRRRYAANDDYYLMMILHADNARMRCKKFRGGY